MRYCNWEYSALGLTLGEDAPLFTFFGHLALLGRTLPFCKYTPFPSDMMAAIHHADCVTVVESIGSTMN